MWAMWLGIGVSVGVALRARRVGALGVVAVLAAVIALCGLSSLGWAIVVSRSLLIAGMAVGAALGTAVGVAVSFALLITSRWLSDLTRLLRAVQQWVGPLSSAGRAGMPGTSGMQPGQRSGASNWPGGSSGWMW